MAYESKVYIVDVHRNGNEITYAERIAEVRLSCMGNGNGWRELFSRDIDYTLYEDDGNTAFDEDRYGDHLKACSIETVTEWLEKEMACSDYRRLSILYGLLKSFNPEQWGTNLEVVHFGY